MPQIFLSGVIMKPLVVSDGILEGYRNLLIGDNAKLNRTTRGRYLFPFSGFLNKRKVPIFLGDNAYHEKDLENIARTCALKNIRKEDLSVVVFDEHTDMYVFDEEGFDEIKKVTGTDVRDRVHLGNWILYMIKQGYTDISLVGVQDFTHSGKRSEYSKYNKDISFYLGPGFNRDKHFDSEDFNKTSLQMFEDFLRKKDFRPYTFVSLDCDVSQSLIGEHDSNHRKCGDLSYGDLKLALAHIRGNSEVVGLSIFGEGWFFGTYSNASDKVNEIVNDFCSA